MNPNIGKWTFRVATIVAPFAVPILIELQQQIRGRALDWWSLGEVGIGAVVSLVVVVFHVQRAGTETAEATAEVATGHDQDADNLTETPSP